ncbi:MAG: macro domain-containing protein [Aggregatilineales bacterium]
MTTLKLLLVNPEEDLCLAWEEYFRDLPDVEIYRGTFQEIEAYDCLVSPANSFGIMDGGIDRAITEFFGVQLMQRVQRRIMDDYLGEQPVGTCMIVETGHNTPRYLAHTPTMRVPMTVSETDNAYTAMWALLTAIHRHNQTDEHKIKRVLCAGLGTGIGAIPADKAAAQMAVAYRRFLSPPQLIDWDYADERHDEIHQANKQQLIQLFQRVQNNPDAVLADRSIESLLSFINGVRFGMVNFDMVSANERRVVQRRGWTWHIKKHYAYEIQERGFGIDEVIQEVLAVHIEVLEG